MSQPKKREPVFECEVCVQPSYQPMPEIDFGEWGKYRIFICGECLRVGDAEKVISGAVNYLHTDIPIEEIVKRMYDVLAEYRQPPQQGS